MKVVGIDGCKDSWMAVELEKGRFEQARLLGTLEQVIRSFPDAAVFGVDIPIGYPVRGSRLADAQARAALGPRGRSVFDAVPPGLLELESFEAVQREVEAVRRRGVPMPCPSRQAWGLKKKILEANRAAAADRRFYEVHPELSFWAMRGQQPVPESKRTWAGFWVRRRLLEQQGIIIPDVIENGELAGPDDVLDAAACAWSASRISRDHAAGCFPPPGQEQPDENGRHVAIWY